MLGDLISYMQGLIISAGAFGVFFASIIEEIFFIIPSALVQLFAGFVLLSDLPIALRSVGDLITLVAIPASLGVFVGSLPVYAIAYVGGEPAIKRWGRWFGISWERVTYLKDSPRARRLKLGACTLMRLLPIVPSAVASAFSGLIRLPLGAYCLSTIIGVFIRSFIVGGIGWLFRSLYHEAFSYGSGAERWGTLLIIFGIVVVLGWRFFYVRETKRRKNKTL